MAFTKPLVMDFSLHFFYSWLAWLLLILTKTLLPVRAFCYCYC